MQSAVRVDPGGWQLTEHTVRTDVLEICYEAGGPEDGPPVLLIHGWPDARPTSPPRSWPTWAASGHTPRGQGRNTPPSRSTSNLTAAKPYDGAYTRWQNVLNRRGNEHDLLPGLQT